MCFLLLGFGSVLVEHIALKAGLLRDYKADLKSGSLVSVACSK